MENAFGMIAIVEDVWGPAFDDLGKWHRIERDEQAWNAPEQLQALAKQSSVLVVRNRTQVTRGLLESAPSLVLVARAGAGLDNIDLEAADELGIVVSAALGVNARSVAEHSLALALALARDLCGHDRALRAGGWDRSSGTELAGRSWGAVGLGATGTETLRLAKAIGMFTRGYDPYLARGLELDALDVRDDSLESLVTNSDVWSLHLPLTIETEGIVDAELLAKARPGAIFINVARGQLVDEAALLAALETGQLAGAGLDVRRNEPPGRTPLGLHPRVICTPHVAGLTEQAQERIVAVLAEDVAAVLAGRPASHAVGRHASPQRASCAN